MKVCYVHVKEIVYTISRDGLLTPNIKIDSTMINGKLYTLLSLKKINNLLNRDIRVGDRVHVEIRNGNIINVKHPILEARSPDSVKTELPTHCPHCNEPITHVKNTMFCNNVFNCKGIIYRRLQNGFEALKKQTKHTVDKGTVRHIVEHLRVQCIGDMYRISENDLRDINVAEYRIQAFLHAINTGKELTFKTFYMMLGFSQSTVDYLIRINLHPDDFEEMVPKIQKEVDNSTFTKETNRFFKSAIARRNWESLYSKVTFI